MALANAERTFDRAARVDDSAWLSYFDEAYLAARMAQCFRDLGEAGHAARYARRSPEMDGRYVRGRAFNLSLLATAYAAQASRKGVRHRRNHRYRSRGAADRRPGDVADWGPRERDIQDRGRSQSRKGRPSPPAHDRSDDGALIPR